MGNVRMEIRVQGEVVELLDKSDPNVRPGKEGSRLKVFIKVPDRVVGSRAIAQNRLELARAMLYHGENMHPTAHTLPATNITSSGAKIWGNVSSRVDATCKFIYWLDGFESDAQEIATSSIGNTQATVEATLTGLDFSTTTPAGTTPPSTMTWYYKVVVTDKYGVAEGQTLSFETTA